MCGGCRGHHRPVLSELERRNAAAFCVCLCLLAGGPCERRAPGALLSRLRRQLGRVFDFDISVALALCSMSTGRAGFEEWLHFTFPSALSVTGFFPAVRVCLAMHGRRACCRAFGPRQQRAGTTCIKEADFIFGFIFLSTSTGFFGL